MDGRVLAIDCGLSFPHEGMPGVDLVLPDFEFLRRRADRLEAIVLTHGHEDHIGSVPYLLREMPAVVYGTALTLELLKGKLEEHGVTDRAELREIVPGEEATAGPFRMRFLRVTHSIPDGVAVAVDTPHGTVLHTGDFKLDQTPLDGPVRPTSARWPRGPSWRAPAAGRLDERRGHRLRAERADGGPGAARAGGPRAPPGGAVVLREPHPPHPAGRRRRVRATSGWWRSWGVRCTRAWPPPAASATSTSPNRTSSPSRSSGTTTPARWSSSRRDSQGEPLSALSLMAAGEHKWVKLKPERHRRAVARR